MAEISEKAQSSSIAERTTRFFGSQWGMILTGGVIGFIGALLPALGNPPNMGICVVGFLGDGAAGLWLLASRLGIDLPTDLTTTCYSLELAPGAQRLEVNPLSLVRPELLGIVLGALLVALLFREFKARAGRGALVLFLLGMCGMMGGIIFWGCPIRALLRLAAGDLNALVGLVGLVAGIGIGTLFLRRGFYTGRAQRIHAAPGFLLPVIGVVLLVGLVVTRDSLPANRPALVVSLVAGLIIGTLAQRSRFCIMSSFRNVLIMRDTLFMNGVLALLAVAMVANLVLGNLNLGFVGQPLAHRSHLWNFLGMAVAGLSFTLAGGCPMRQLIRSGEGNLNAAAYVVGMVTMGAVAHRFNFYPEADKVLPIVTIIGGPTAQGKVAVLAAALLTLLIAAGGVMAANRRQSAHLSVA
jgi:YedE family putative selenium metabolism protein